MKKIMLFIVLIVLAVNAFGQKKETLATNVPDWIVGTWISRQGKKLVFNADGTTPQGSNLVKFMVIDGCIFFDEQQYSTFCNYYLSDDKKTLMVVWNNSVAKQAVWYVKQ